MEVILSDPPKTVIYFFIDSVVDICEAFRDRQDNASFHWLTAVLQKIPNTIFTQDESARILKKFNTDNIKFLEDELSIIYKRTRNHNRRWVYVLNQ